MTGLSATELAEVLQELREDLTGAEVADLARLNTGDDLLLFVQASERRRALHIAPGGPRARVCTTRRRFSSALFATGPRIDGMRNRLVGTTIDRIDQPAGERCCTIWFARNGREDVALAVELFGPRGLWCVLDVEHRIEEMSRLPKAGKRALAPGAKYAPPRPRGAAEDPPSRFAAPFAESIDAHFTPEDLEREQAERRQRIETALQRNRRKLEGRLAGLDKQIEAAAAAPDVRRDADMILAYLGQVRRGSTELVVPHPDGADQELRIPLDPALPPQGQAKALYRKARKLENGVDAAQRSQESARAHLATLDGFAADLAACEDDRALRALEQELDRAGYLGKQTQAPPPQPPKVAKVTRGENFRRFESAEGYLILVGRTNVQNDTLTRRVARGNDLWFHVGQGYAGSHVVVRLPRGKTASLETMLDAGVLAVHFSKARGADRCDVVYTQAKHVRKPKGAPAGSVLPSHTKNLTVRRDDDRLRRLVDSSRS